MTHCYEVWSRWCPLIQSALEAKGASGIWRCWMPYASILAGGPLRARASNFAESLRFTSTKEQHIAALSCVPCSPLHLIRGIDDFISLEESLICPDTLDKIGVHNTRLLQNTLLYSFGILPFYIELSALTKCLVTKMSGNASMVALSKCLAASTWSPFHITRKSYNTSGKNATRICQSTRNDT